MSNYQAKKKTHKGPNVKDIISNEPFGPNEPFGSNNPFNPIYLEKNAPYINNIKPATSKNQFIGPRGIVYKKYINAVMKNENRKLSLHNKANTKRKQMLSAMSTRVAENTEIQRRRAKKARNARKQLMTSTNTNTSGPLEPTISGMNTGNPLYSIPLPMSKRKPKATNTLNPPPLPHRGYSFSNIPKKTKKTKLKSDYASLSNLNTSSSSNSNNNNNN